MGLNKITVGSAEISVGTAGSEPNSAIGYTREGCEISWSIGGEEVAINEKVMGAGVIATEAEVTVKFEMAESTAANLQKAIGETGAAFTDGLAKFSLKVVGTAGAGTVTLSCLNGYAEGAEVVIKRGDAFYVPMNFTALAWDNGSPQYPTITFA